MIYVYNNGLYWLLLSLTMRQTFFRMNYPLLLSGLEIYSSAWVALLCHRTNRHDSSEWLTLTLTLTESTWKHNTSTCHCKVCNAIEQNLSEGTIDIRKMLSIWVNHIDSLNAAEMRMRNLVAYAPFLIVLVDEMTLCVWRLWWLREGQK